MIEFLVNLLRVGPILSALLIVAAVNVTRPRRVEQTWMPLVGIVFTAVAMVLLYRFNDVTATALDSAGLDAPLLPNGSGTPWWYVIENTAVLLVFALIKFVLKPVFARFFKGGGDIAQFVTARVYKFDPDFDLWFIERRFRRVRDFYRAAYWSSVAITVLLVALALTYSGWPGFSTIAFPALATMLIGEFYFAVDGLTREEYAEELTGERDVARRVGNFGPLRRVLRETFPERAIGEGVHISSLASLDSGYRIGEMTRSSDPSIRLAGAYFDRLRRGRVDLDVNHVGAAAELLSGCNVLFADPFHEDLTPYLCLPAYRELLEGRKVLLIAGRNSLAGDLAGWMNRGLEDITGVPRLWNVRLLDEVRKEEVDVGVLRFADLHNLDLLQHNDPFFQDVGLLILAEPSLMLATGQLGLELVLDRCSRGSRAPTIAIFDGNHDGLVDTLSHLTKSNLTEVVASALPQGACSEVIWRADGAHMQTSILPGVSRYLGVGTEISAVALKYHVSEIHWVGADSFPVVDMHWIAQQYYAPINQFSDLEMSQDALGDRLVAVSNPWDLKQADNYFLVVEDPLKNVYETVRRYATRAKRSGFVNLISDEYLMRDYMVENRDLFAVDPKAIPSIVPDYTRTERNVVLRLLLTLRSFGMSEAELAKQMDILGWCVPDTLQLVDSPQADWEPASIVRLRRAIQDHTGLADAPLAVDVNREMGRRILDDADLRYLLEAGSRLDDVLGSLAPAYFFVEDEVDGTNVIGSLLLDHVHQAMLPGQFLTYDGKYYEVQSITSDRSHGRVILRRAADHIRDRRVYRQIRHYTLANVRSSEVIGARRTVGEIEVIRSAADITAQSLGYLECRTRSDLANARKVSVAGVPDRRYLNKSVLQIRLPSATPEVRRTIALMLNELFVTTFPYAFPYISALTADPDSYVGELTPSLDVTTSSELPADVAETSIFIVEDSMIDMGLTAAIERNWERLFEIVTDYLEWIEEPEGELPGPVELDPSRLFPERPMAAVPMREVSWLERATQHVKDLFSREASSRASVARKADDSLIEVQGPALPDASAVSRVEVESVRADSYFGRDVQVSADDPGVALHATPETASAASGSSRVSEEDEPSPGVPGEAESEVVGDVEGEPNGAQ